MSSCPKEIQCPSCLQSEVKTLGGHRTLCRRCSKFRRRVFQFCWACEREWPRKGCPGDTCPLPGCELRAALLSGEVITDPSSSAVGCPFFRACPTCKALLTHNGVGCPNISCPRCFTEFCFRCLREDCYDSVYYDSEDEYEDEDVGELDQSRDVCRIVDNSDAVRSLGN